MLQFIRELRFYYLVHFAWRRYKIGKNLYAGARVYLWARERLEIGDNFYIGRDSEIQTDSIIGDNVMFGNKVAIVGKYDHHYQQIGTPMRLAARIRDASYNWKGLNQLTIVEDDVWVGYGSVIMSGVKISKGCIIAAGSVVTHDTEPYHIYAGNPARKIKPRFESESMLAEHIQLEKSVLEAVKGYKGVKSVAV